MLILGIDPGPTESAYCYVTAEQTVDATNKVGNEGLIEMVRSSASSTGHVALESIQSYGMAVGREVFDTCFMIGRLIQVCKDLGLPYTLIPRPEYTRRICGAGKVNDAILRQALELRFGGYGEIVSSEVIPEGEPGAGLYKGGPRKGQPRIREVRTPQPLHALNCTDKRSAFAVAVYYIDLARVGA
ncbi:MAG: hypothetical protein WCV62_05875 [Candidatus Peribacteraceae bacterium]